jgi:lipoprotein-releasing system ATP-binding protein
MKKEVAIECLAIDKWFNTPQPYQVLHQLSMQAYKGEFLSLVGKSGSGKSTLLYCLSTMDNDYQGQVRINGNLVTGLGQDELAHIRNQHIGFVFQFHYLLPEFTCIQNIMMPALRLGVKSKQQIEADAEKILGWLDLSDQMLKPVTKMSGGQQQRVAIARALINDPTILLCDEPTGNLDSRNAQLVFDVFKTIASESKQCIIAVTHDLEFAKASDRVLELRDGRIEP